MSLADDEANSWPTLRTLLKSRPSGFSQRNPFDPLFQITETQTENCEDHDQFRIAQNTVARLDLGIGVVGNRPTLALQLPDDKGCGDALGQPDFLQFGAEGISSRSFRADASGHTSL